MKQTCREAVLEWLAAEFKTHNRGRRKGRRRPVEFSAPHLHEAGLGSPSRCREVVKALAAEDVISRAEVDGEPAVFHTGESGRPSSVYSYAE